MLPQLPHKSRAAADCYNAGGRSYNIIIRPFVECCIMHSKNKNTVQNDKKKCKKNTISNCVGLLYARLSGLVFVKKKKQIQSLLGAHTLL